MKRRPVRMFPNKQGVMMMGGTPGRDWTENAFDDTLYVRASHELNGTPEQRQAFLDGHRERTRDQLAWLARQEEGRRSRGEIATFIKEKVIEYNRKLCDKAAIN